MLQKLRIFFRARFPFFGLSCGVRPENTQNRRLKNAQNHP